MFVNLHDKYGVREIRLMSKWNRPELRKYTYLDMLQDLGCGSSVISATAFGTKGQEFDHREWQWNFLVQTRFQNAIHRDGLKCVLSLGLGS